MADLQAEGSYNVVITDYGLAEMETGAVAINVRCLVQAAFDPATGEYADWSQYEEQHVEGALWVINKKGEVNKSQVEPLCRYAGWDGSLESIVNKTWQPNPIRADVKVDTYGGKTRYRVNWIAQHGSAPGGVGNVDGGRAKELQAQHGGNLRAIAGAFTHDSKAPGNGNRPKAPPAPKAAPVAAGGTAKEDSPF